MTFGNYVLFNLLVAILVEGFSMDGDVSVRYAYTLDLNPGIGFTGRRDNRKRKQWIPKQTYAEESLISWLVGV